MFLLVLHGCEKIFTKEKIHAKKDETPVPFQYSSDLDILDYTWYFSFFIFFFYQNRKSAEERKIHSPMQYILTQAYM